MKKAQQQFSGKLGAGRDDYQRNKGSCSISPNDHMSLFMSASKQIASTTDSALEKNARIFKWLNNCKNARAWWDWCDRIEFGQKKRLNKWTRPCWEQSRRSSQLKMHEGRQGERILCSPQEGYNFLIVCIHISFQQISYFSISYSERRVSSGFIVWPKIQKVKWRLCMGKACIKHPGFSHEHRCIPGGSILTVALEISTWITPNRWW